MTTTAHDLSTPEGLSAYRKHLPAKLFADAQLDLAIVAYCTKRAQYSEESIARFREQARSPLDPTAAALLDAIFAQWSAR